MIDEDGLAAEDVLLIEVRPPHEPASTPIIRPARRAAVYLPVLGTAMLVTVIGLAALLGARVQRESAGAEHELAAARAHARAAVELAMLRVRTESDWRSQGTTWASDRPIGDGTFSITAHDPVDGDIAVGDSDPVELTGTGTSGSARYSMRVTMQPGSGPVELSTALIAGGSVTVYRTDLRSDQVLAVNGSFDADRADVSGRHRSGRSDHRRGLPGDDDQTTSGPGPPGHRRHDPGVLHAGHSDPDRYPGRPWPLPADQRQLRTRHPALGSVRWILRDPGRRQRAWTGSCRCG